jgi:hypothetical protein
VIFTQYLTPESAQILQILNRTGVVIRENTKVCGKKWEWDAWTLSANDHNNPYKRIYLSICTSTIQKNYGDWEREINRTLTHESAHISQASKHSYGGLEKLGIGKTIEEEAVKLQDNPYEVIRILRKYCIKTD